MRNLFRAPAHPRCHSENAETVRSNLEPSIDRRAAVSRGDGRRRKAFALSEPVCVPLQTSKRVLGGVFRFESRSRELLELVETAYGRVPPQAFPGIATEFRVAMRLLPRSVNAWAIEPPAPCIRQEGDRIRADIDGSNYVIIDCARRRAHVVATEDMLRHAYHLRCELIEFAVFVLATRGVGLAPLHAACVGIGGRGLLLLGASGSGKSTLALHGMVRGLDLLAEDAVFVQPATLLATGVPNYLHLRHDVLDFIAGDAMLAWITHAPVIRRRSGVEKFEVDLRRGYGRPAPSPLVLVGAVFATPLPADNNDALLTQIPRQQAGRMLEADQPHASRQPGWRAFKRGILDKGVYQLRRGRHPGDSVNALRRLLA